MANTARSANNLLRTDKLGMVDMRRGSPVLGGTFVYDGDDLVTGWHSHDLHELEYALWGVVEVETDAGHYLLPPQQAAWLPAGLAHQTTIHTSVRSISVLLHPSLVPDAGDRARILSVEPVVKEMTAYATKWPIGRSSGDELADRYFGVLARLVGAALNHEAPLSLPTSQNPVVRAAMTFTTQHLDDVTIHQVASEAGVSERTLRRFFDADPGMSWRQYLLHARLLRAMALLSESGPTVTEVSVTVGFDSVSAFTRAFVRHTGETPSAYRRRARAALPG